jgi:hypothetical protein
VRIVLGEVAVSPIEAASTYQGLRMRQAIEGLVELRLGAEILAEGVLCLHRGKLAVRVSKIADLVPRIPADPGSRVFKSEGV